MENNEKNEGKKGIEPANEKELAEEPHKHFSGYFGFRNKETGEAVNEVKPIHRRYITVEPVGSDKDDDFFESFPQYMDDFKSVIEEIQTIDELLKKNAEHLKKVLCFVERLGSYVEKRKDVPDI